MQYQSQNINYQKLKYAKYAIKKPKLAAKIDKCAVIMTIYLREICHITG